MPVNAQTFYLISQSTVDCELKLAEVRFVLPFDSFLPPKLVLSLSLKDSHLSFVNIYTNDKLLPGDSGLFQPVRFLPLFSHCDSSSRRQCDSWLGDESVYLSLLLHVIGGAILVRIFKHSRDFVVALSLDREGGRLQCVGLLYTQVSNKKGWKHTL